MLHLLINLYWFYIVDCGWSQWSKWSECSETCGLGYTQRQRSPDQPMSLYGGKNCTGQLYESIECNLKGCPSIYITICFI